MAEVGVTVKKRHILVLAVLAVSMAMSAETWRFLPCFHNDLRGIERADFAEGHFYDAVPEAQ